MSSLLFVTFLVLCFAGLCLPSGLLLFPRAERGLLTTMLTGMCMQFAVFELLETGWMLAKGSFSLLTGAWVFVALVTAALGILRFRRSERNIPFSLVSVPNRLSRREWLYLVLGAAMILFQVLRIELYYTPSAADDLDYIGISSTTLYTDTLFQYSQFTGVAIDFRFNFERSLSPWPIFVAMFAKLSGVHPAAVFHSVLPLFLLPLFYAVAYLLFAFFFRGSREKALLGVLCSAVFFEFTAVDQAFLFWWPINEPWTGKAFGPGVLTMFVWYLFLLLTEAEDSEQWPLWSCLFIACLASVMVSNTCAILIPELLGSCGLVWIIRSKRLSLLPKLFLGVSPCLISAALNLLF